MIYSKRLGDISKEQFQKALDRFELGILLKAEATAFGNFGQNVFVSSSKGEFVLRGKPHYSGQFESERLAAKLLYEKTEVPVPWPYLLDESDDIFGWSYVIMPRLKGQQFGQKTLGKLPRADGKAIAAALGENLALMHGLAWDYPGEYAKDSGYIKPFSVPFPNWVDRRVHELLAKSSSYNEHTKDQDRAWMDEIIDEGRDALEITFTPCFVMQDYQITNVVVDNVGGQWTVSGVFDFVESYFGDGEADLSRTVADYIEHDESGELSYAFLNAYANHGKIREGFEKRFPIYMVMDRLIIWEWAQRNGKYWWDQDLSFREWCEEFLKVDFRRLTRTGNDTLM